MTDEFKARLADRFEGFELVEYLQIPVEDVIERFADFIEQAEEDLDEFIKHGR